MGCCGSPMLPIYISLFGSKAAGIGKPLVALISLISIGGGYRYVMRRPDAAVPIRRPVPFRGSPFPGQSSAGSARQNSATLQTDLDHKETV